MSALPNPKACRQPPAASCDREWLLPSLTLIAMVTAAAYGLRQVSVLSAFSPMIAAIFIGIGFSSFISVPESVTSGVASLGKFLLRLAIVLLGFQLTLLQIAEVGLLPMVALGFIVAATFVVTLWLGRLLGVGAGLAGLLAAGTSICGASAIAAANVVQKNDDEDVAYAVASVTIFGSIVMLIYPLLGHMAGLSAAEYGYWVGSSIHEVAQVAAAGFQHGTSAGEQSIVVKLSRVILLAPMLMAMSAAATRSTGVIQGKLAVSQILPLFVVGFILCVIVNTLGLLPPMLKTLIVDVTPIMLTAALGALGLGASFSAIRARGMRPLLVAAIATVFISGLSFILIRFIM